MQLCQRPPRHQAITLSMFDINAMCCERCIATELVRRKIHERVRSERSSAWKQ